MTLDELDDWAASFKAFHARFAELFELCESREQAQKYLRGLLSNVERKNGWQLAEVVGDAMPDRTQRLLYQVNWDAEAARDRLQQFVIETFGEEEGIGVVDETGFLKKGEHSVGVQRQYCEAAGKIENCQVATVLSYASPAGHVFLDRRLYLPQEKWCWNRARRAKATCPGRSAFKRNTYKPSPCSSMPGSKRYRCVG
jgi:SRSO17 transposase